MSEPKSIDEVIEDIQAAHKRLIGIDTIIAVIVLVLTIVLIGLIIRRKELQPIKVKGWKLITLSIFGNSMAILVDFLIKNNYSVLAENEDIINSDITHKANLNMITDGAFPLNELEIQQVYEYNCMAQSLRSCFFGPLFLLPYFLRAIRLLSIFK